MDFTLTLWTNSVERMRWADAAGVDRIGLDLEHLGKADRQAGLGTWLSPHSLDDLGKLARHVKRAARFVRSNPLNPETAAELDILIGAGVSVLMLPNFTSLDEVARYSDMVSGRAQVVPLVERLGAVEAIDGFRSIGVEEFHVGLNDLSIELGLTQRLGVLVAPVMDRIAGKAEAHGLTFGVGGLARAGDRSLPVCADLLYAQQARLRSRGALLARVFFNRPMDQAAFATEIERLRVAPIRLVSGLRRGASTGQGSTRDRARQPDEAEGARIVRAKGATPKTLRYSVNGVELSADVHGETFIGTQGVLLEGDENLISGTAWEAEGHHNVDLLSPRDLATLRSGIAALLSERLSVARQRPVTTTLEDYHSVVLSDEEHLRVMKSLLGGFPAEALPIPLAHIEERLSAACSRPLWCRNPSRGKRTFQLRIVRPLAALDHNPPHRDVWVDALRHAVNAYIPLAGSNAKSALPLIPGSHLWPDSEIERTLVGARIAGVTYHVPSVVAAKQPLRLLRPNPAAGQAMIFSPYLVHGGGINFNRDMTRVSLELRLWRRSRASASAG